MRKRDKWRVASGEWRALVTFIAATSFVIGLAVCAPRVVLAQKAAHRANELTLAGLRPGRDTREAAIKKLGKPWGLPRSSGDGSSEDDWNEACTGSVLHVEFDGNGVIQTMQADFQKVPAATCQARANRRMPWPTGRGVRLQDLRSKVIATYGKPGSVSPSTKDGRELELLYYAFDWAGPDVPQVMEITCERATGRVVEILLAFPSL